MLPNIHWTKYEILNFFGLPEDTLIESKKPFPLQGPQVLVYKIVFYNLTVQYSVGKKIAGTADYFVGKKIAGTADYFVGNPNDNFPSSFEVSYKNMPCIRYYKDGLLHRAYNKPAVLTYKNNYLVGEYFYINGKMHNKHGPAYRYRDNISSCWHNNYWVNGKQLSSNTFFERYFERYNVT